MQQSDFEVAREKARVWEIKVAKWARRRGWYVVPTYDFSGKGDDKAPKLLAPIGCRDLVLPDLQCFKDHEIKWLEVKFKTQADLYRKTQTLVTGVSLRLWNHYLELQQVSGGKVFLVFLHEKEREVRGDCLDNLRQYESHTYDGRKMGRGGMIFFRYEQIQRWGSLETIEREAAA